MQWIRIFHVAKLQGSFLHVFEYFIDPAEKMFKLMKYTSD